MLPLVCTEQVLGLVFIQCTFYLFWAKSYSDSASNVDDHWVINTSAIFTELEKFLKSLLTPCFALNNFELAASKIFLNFKCQNFYPSIFLKGNAVEARKGIKTLLSAVLIGPSKRRLISALLCKLSLLDSINKWRSVLLSGAGRQKAVNVVSLAWALIGLFVWAARELVAMFCRRCSHPVCRWQNWSAKSDEVVIQMKQGCMKLTCLMTGSNLASASRSHVLCVT